MLITLIPFFSMTFILGDTDTLNILFLTKFSIPTAKIIQLSHVILLNIVYQEFNITISLLALIFKYHISLIEVFSYTDPESLFKKLLESCLPSYYIIFYVLSMLFSLY